jgi:hypothetical protein
MDDDDDPIYRQELVTYAINDCMAMERILKMMKLNKFQIEINKKKSLFTDLKDLSPISSSDDEDDDIFAYTRNKTIRTVSISNPIENDELKFISNNLISISRAPSIERNYPSKTNIRKNFTNTNWNTNSSNTIPAQTVSTSTERQYAGQSSNQVIYNRQQLTKEEKKKMHNRNCTLKQRKRCYRIEIIRRNIDNRFSITKIKQILKQLNVPFNIVNKSTSSISKKTSLFIGMKDPLQLNIYERATRGLFSKEHYNEMTHAHRHGNRYEAQRERQHEAQRERQYEAQRERQHEKH